MPLSIIQPPPSINGVTSGQKDAFMALHVTLLAALVRHSSANGARAPALDPFAHGATAFCHKPDLCLSSSGESGRLIRDIAARSLSPRE